MTMPRGKRRARHGTYKAEGAGRQGRYEAEGVGHHDQDQDSGDTDPEGEEAQGRVERVNTAEPIDSSLNITNSEKKTQGSIGRNIASRPYKDVGKDIQGMRVIMADLLPALTMKVQREVAEWDEAYQKLKSAVREGKKPKDREVRGHNNVEGV